MNKEDMRSYGIDYDKGIQNCMGNAVFYKKILSMFLSDTCFSRAKTAFQNGDKKEMFSCMHEMKGISGNAALTELYAVCSPLVELLRTESEITAEIKEMFSVAEKAYNKACQGIGKYLEEPSV